ncbi:LuxR C-terminal-related transcriptional regulator [Brevibacterium sp. W7.2]|uniref:LuxR C-terminal-related transcriptional regulator n=1 Tax=Brevibacterium sp. W7.2 TaxID=2823518 RepID=UPI001BA71079|nr:LuxR C-terminal-related transcriptional regulator [Brevibacterium sp. W7.2]
MVEDICARAVTEGGMLCMLTGFAGTGKTWLLRRIGETMFRTSPVAFATADEFEKDVPFSFVERLLSTGLAPFRILDGSRAPLDVAREIMAELTDNERPPLQTVLVDDAQWIDVESRLVLRYLVPRIMRQGYLIVVAGRLPDVHGAPVSFIADLAESSPQGENIVLEPLTIAEIQALAVDLLGASISAFTAESLRNATGGSFLGIDSIFRRITPQERNKLHLLWDIPIRGVDPEHNPLLAPVLGLSPAARLAVEIVCCADTELAPYIVAEVADRLGEPADIHPAVAASVLSESGFGATIAPRHALIAHAVRQMLPRERAQAIYRALAPSATGFRRMWYALSGAEEWTDELAAAVDGFIAESVAARSYAAVNDVMRRSLDIATGEARQTMLIRLALLNMRGKTVYAVLDLLPEVEALPECPVRECIILTMLAHRKDQEFPRERLERFLAEATDDPDVRTLQSYAAYLSVVEVIRSRDFGRLSPVIDAALATIARAPHDPAELTRPGIRWMVAPQERTMVLETYRLLQLVLEADRATVIAELDALVPRVLALEPSSFKVDALTPLAVVAMTIGEVGRARTLAGIGVGLLESVVKPWGAGTVRLLHAHATSLTGSLDEAAELVLSATESSGSTIDVETRLPLSGLHAWLNAARGVPDFIDLEAQTDRQTSMQWQPYAADMVITASCERARAHGDPERVLAASAPEKVKSLIGTQRGFLNYRAHALLDLGRFAEADALIDRLGDMEGTSWQPYWGSVDWLRARRIVARSGLTGGDAAGAVAAETASDRSDAAAEALRCFEAALNDDRFPLPRALTLRDYGVVLAGLGRSEEARKALDQALAIVRRIGAGAYEPGIRDALSTVAESEQDLLASLTNRELEIGRLLAQGRSNQEIAAELFVATATVRYHVSNLLRKLQLNRRSEVARMFR